jgi:hypothetical protein
LDASFPDYCDNRGVVGLYGDCRSGSRHCADYIRNLSHLIPDQPDTSIGSSIAESAAKKIKLMNKAIGLALLAVGIALIIYGVDANQSTASSLSKTFTGSPTNKAMWLLIGGIASAVVGGVMTIIPARRS